MNKSEIENVDMSLLEKLELDSLRFIKQEADNHLDEIESSSNIVGSKASSYFQIFIAILVPILGYIISMMEKQEYGILFGSAIILFISLSISIFLLYQSIFPKNIFLKGIPPFMVAKDTVITVIGDATNPTERQMLLNRIHNINIDIQENLHTQIWRSDKLKKASDSFIYGIGTCVVYSILYFVIAQFFPCLLCFAQ